MPLILNFLLEKGNSKRQLFCGACPSDRPPGHVWYLCLFYRWVDSPFFVMALPLAVMFGMLVVSFEMLKSWEKDVRVSLCFWSRSCCIIVIVRKHSWVLYESETYLPYQLPQPALWGDSQSWWFANRNVFTLGQFNIFAEAYYCQKYHSYFATSFVYKTIILKFPKLNSNFKFWSNAC